MEDTASSPNAAFKTRFSQFLCSAKPALPACVGVAFANTCFNVTLNGSALYFNKTILENGPQFITIALLALFMIWLARRKKPLANTTARGGIVCCIVLQIAAAIGLGLLEFAYSDVNVLRMVFVVVMYVGAFGSLAFWLRCERNVSAQAAAIVVFGAVLISEPLICLAAFIPPSAAYAMLAAVALAQALCLRSIQTTPLPCDMVDAEHNTPIKKDGRKSPCKDTECTSAGYFNLAETIADNKRLLITTALGIWILSLAKAVIRVFPSGEPIPYTSTTLAVYFVLSMVLTAVLLHLALGKRKNIMTVGIWLVMQNIAALALIACGFLPERLDIGLGFAYVLDMLLFAYTWYVAIAFMSYGRQDPYYYVAGGLIAYLLPRFLTNVVMPLMLGGIDHATATTAVAAALLLLCAQFLFLQFPHMPGAIQDRQKQPGPLSHAAVRAFGIDAPADTSTAMRIAIMRSHAVCMQKQFLLSDRETEVLALYALGHTQDKIAEELFLSPSTVHTYVKRLYGKTDLHSRQAILDYIERYAE